MNQYQPSNPASGRHPSRDRKSEDSHPSLSSILLQQQAESNQGRGMGWTEGLFEIDREAVNLGDKRGRVWREACRFSTLIPS